MCVAWHITSSGISKVYIRSKYLGRMLWGNDKNVVIFGNLSAGGGGGGGPEGGLSHPLLMFTVWLFQLPVTLFLYTC